MAERSPGGGFGSETKKALSNFGPGTTPAPLIRAYGEVKKAAITAIQGYQQRFSDEQYRLLIEACDLIIRGSLEDQFPVDIRQGGAGTSLHMNICEVIADHANAGLPKAEQLHPLDDIALYQSTNDTFPTALIIMVLRFLIAVEELIVSLQERLVAMEFDYRDVLLTGRTELQDALPITLGQVCGAWAGMAERDRWRINKLKERLREIPLGGTAMGTCFSAPKKYVNLVEKSVRTITGLPLSRSQNLSDAVAHKDSLAEVANGLGIVAGNLYKLSGDLLLYSSSLCGEIEHPKVQYGSTIMASKSNPVFLELIKGLAIGIEYETSLISRYCNEGQLQLNPFLPFIAAEFHRVWEDLRRALTTLVDKFLPAVRVNRSKIRENLLSSPVLLNSLRKFLDYTTIKEIDAEIKKRQIADLEDLIQLIAERTDLDRDFLERWFEPGAVTSYPREDGTTSKATRNQHAT